MRLVYDFVAAVSKLFEQQRVTVGLNFFLLEKMATICSYLAQTVCKWQQLEIVYHLYFQLGVKAFDNLQSTKVS